MTQRKKVLISGASSGIGAATARRFGAEGWDVCLIALPPAGQLQAVKDSLPPGDHLVYAGDFSDPAFMHQLGAELQAHWGWLDVLVSCAGVWWSVDTLKTPMEEWRRCFDIMVNGAVYITRAAAPLLSVGGRIIHITSIHGERAGPECSAYAMAKAAVNQWCRNLALELGPRGILVNAIAPGFINTAMSIVNGVNELESDWFKRDYIEGDHLPLKRPGQPEEVAGVAWFLAGPDASYITGQVIAVDGGLSITF